MPTKIVGILNITPDSFSDGGKFTSLDNAITHLKEMLNDGADMIDIGAESTRPGFTPVSTEEEWKRLEKILPAITSEVKNFNQKTGKKVTTSIDTRHFETAKKAFENGVDIINDVDGLIDDRTIEFIAKNNITTILMHNLSVPAVEGTLINRHLNLTDEIIKWAQEKISYLMQKGVKKSQLIFDVGIGFGKDSLQSIRILKNIDAFRVLGLPLYVGHSKKSFLDAIDFSEMGELEPVPKLFTSDRRLFCADDKKQFSSDMQLSEENFPKSDASKEPRDEAKSSLLPCVVWEQPPDRANKTLVISKYLIKKNVDFIRVHDIKRNFLLKN
ncbi:MAG: dihydropteroate synthase [Rickettsiales bacterium]|nr:dihydropteroate synthase [Rickettsiales bacterium]